MGERFRRKRLQTEPCPNASLFAVETKELLGSGEKSGVYYALDPETGGTVWKTKVGPGGTTGGSEWEPATDGDQVHVAISNSLVKTWDLVKDGEKTGNIIHRGLWSALDTKPGEIIWQTPELH